MYLYAKDLKEEKYQYLINKREKVGLKHFNDPKAFLECSIDMQDLYKNIDEYNLGKKRKILIVFDDMITDIINNKTFNSVMTELFIRGKKSTFQLHLLQNHILKCQKMLDYILHTVLPWKFQRNKNNCRSRTKTNKSNWR